MAAQTTRKIHILHQRDVGEATESLENQLPYKQRLITEKRAKLATAQSLPGFEPS